MTARQIQKKCQSHTNKLRAHVKDALEPENKPCDLLQVQGMGAVS